MTAMVLPTKRIHQDRALLSVGGSILRTLSGPMTVSRLWTELSTARRSGPNAPTITYDWFVLALDLLFAMKAIDLDRGLLSKRTP